MAAPRPPLPRPLPFPGTANVVRGLLSARPLDMSSILAQQNALPKRLKAQPVLVPSTRTPYGSLGSSPTALPTQNGKSPPSARPRSSNRLKGDEASSAGTSSTSLASTTTSANNASGSSTTQLYHVIRFLKQSHPSPETIPSIIAATGVTDKEILSKLKLNERVIYDEARDTYKYRATFELASKADLLNLVFERRYIQGIEVKELKDSWAEVTPAIEELFKEGKILVIRAKDESPRIVFANEAPPDVADTKLTDIDEDFRSTWAELKVPEEQDLEREMEKSGLKGMETKKGTTTGTKRQKGRQKRAGGYKRVKITNTHLSALGIDLKKELMGGQG